MTSLSGSLTFRHLLRRAAVPAVLGALTTITACASDDVAAPPPAVAGAFTVDATTRWVYVSLADSAVVTPTPSAPESGAWDIAFNATNVMLNGGQAGPGGVTGACLCQNTNVPRSNAEWLALNEAGEKIDFDTVSAVPAAAAFSSDVLTPALTGWFAGSGAAATASPDSVYFVRLADSTGIAKVHVTALQNASATNAGRITVEYALANNADAAFGATRTVTVDLTTGAKRLDLNTGTVGTTGTDWELAFDGFAVRVNGGASGPGKAAAAKITTATFATATPAATAVNAYRADVYAGVFNTFRFYKYNLGGDNRITPTFDVYFIRRGAATYKLQIVNYYNATGQARHITFRYQQISR